MLSRATETLTRHLLPPGSTSFWWTWSKPSSKATKNSSRTSCSSMTSSASSTSGRRRCSCASRTTLKRLAKTSHSPWSNSVCLILLCPVTVGIVFFFLVLYVVPRQLDQYSLIVSSFIFLFTYFSFFLFILRDRKKPYHLYNAMDHFYSVHRGISPGSII